MSYKKRFIKEILETDLVSAKTKEVLVERIEAINNNYKPAFFTEHEFSILLAVSDILIPQDDQSFYINLAASIDERLSENKNNGWRFASLPADGDCYRKALTAINKMCTQNLKKEFTEANTEEKQKILLLVQQGTSSDVWINVNSKLFFEELLAELTEAYYSHPLIQEEIGYAGMADQRGWIKIGLNEKDAPEP
jgi:gluconate 2-dehydrogenase gamma chain